MTEMIPFGEYRPDCSDFNGSTTAAINNVIPRADGYGPFKTSVPITAALPAVCRGYFYARDEDGSVKVFAGTVNRLYVLNNTTLQWEDVSKGATTYTSLNPDANWSFAQFGTLVVAVQQNINPQVFDLSSDTAFDDLGGSPPKAAYVSVVNQFLMLSGLQINPKRIQWSGLNDVTNWTSGVNSSDYQDEPDGGFIRGVIGGEFGTILQDQMIRRMTFSPGSDVIFEIQKLAENLGALGPYAICSGGSLHFFLTPKGFHQVDNSGGLTPIGEEKVNRTFFASYDSSNPQLLQAMADPNSNIVMFVWKSVASSQILFDSALIYNYVLQRWAPLSVSGEALAQLAAPGLTMEALDAIAPGAQTISGAANNGSGKIRLTVGSTSGWTTGDYKTISGVVGTTEANGTWAITVIDGTHIDLNGSTYTHAYSSGGIVGGSLDALQFSLDTVGLASLPALSCCDSTHRVGTFTGQNLEAVLETAEQSGNGQRLRIRGFTPITDASDVKGTISKRENLRDTRTYLPESTMNGEGVCPLIWSTRYARARVRIPSGQTWSFASGVIPDAGADGQH
jgi:hypothetical protein